MKAKGFRLIELLLVMVVMFVLAGFLSGCATTGNKPLIDPAQLAQFDKQNAAFSRSLAREICSTWSLNSGFLTPMLVDLKGFITCDCDTMIKTLDGIAAKCTKKDADGNLTCEELSDADLGLALYTWGKTWGSIIQSGGMKIMQTFFPAVLSKISPILSALGLM